MNQETFLDHEDKEPLVAEAAVSTPFRQKIWNSWKQTFG